MSESKEDGHASDCAIHNAPAYAPEACDCIETASPMPASTVLGDAGPHVVVRPVGPPITTDEAIAQAWARVPVDSASDQVVSEIRLQFGQDYCNATISRDTFSQDPLVTDFYGCGRTPAEAILNAIACYEDSLLKARHG